LRAPASGAGNPLQALAGPADTQAARTFRRLSDAGGVRNLESSRPMLARLASFAALLCASAVAHAASVDVFVTDLAGKPLADAVVMLEPVGAALPVKPMTGVRIAQQDLQFNPQVSVVTVGSPVLFPNQDTVRHHVYSYSSAKTFQIKLYAGVPHTPIVFDKPGIAVLGCNIHDSMLAWVVVTDTPLWARSAADGKARVADVPLGNYQMRVWHASLAETTPPQSTPLTVGGGGVVEQRVQLGPAGMSR
jgi:plastocyanin